MSNVLSTRRQALAAAALPALLPAQGAPDDTTLRRLLEPPKGKVRAVIDTDTYNEIDDQYAVLYGLLSPDRIAVEAIYAAPYLNARSTSAADGMEKSYQEILRLLKFLGRDTKGMVFRGSESFLPSAAKPVESEAMRDLIAKALQPGPGPLYVLTLGCPANVASAILAEPKIKDKIVVVWLGGATHEWPSAREFNLFQDIHASRVLFNSGVPLMQIPTKNVSEHLRTTLPEAEFWLKGKSRLCDYLYEQFVDYYRTHTKGKPQPYPWSKVIWDISTVAWVLDPSWIPSALVPSPLLTDDFRWQKQPGRHTIRVATNALRDPVFHDLFTKLAKVK
ncbi:MAG: nucleoside hydrolase [Acidobacteria bacterium]|nr:nucleoside hydrolase [Acidobacteriota bacterium]